MTEENSQCSRIIAEANDEYNKGWKAALEMNTSYPQLDDIMQELETVRRNFKRENQNLIGEDGDKGDFDSELETEERRFWYRKACALTNKDVTTAFAHGFGDALENLYDSART